MHSVHVVFFFFGFLVLYLNNCIIMLIKVFRLNISDYFLRAFLGNFNQIPKQSFIQLFDAAGFS